MRLHEPEWMDEDDALDAIRVSRHCSELFVLECYLDAAKAAGVPTRPGEVERAAFLKWLKSAFRASGAKLGRPRRWDWNAAINAANQFAGNFGIPDRQAKLEQYVQDWFSKRDSNGGSPDIGDVRKWIGPVYKRLKGEM